MNGSPFSKSAIALILATALGLFALSVLLHAYDNSPRALGNTTMPGSYSVSAIGHAGLYGMLEKLGLPVKRSTGNTQALVGRSGSLVLAEPDFNHIDSEYELMLMQVPRILLVLPKWRGSADPMRPDWIAEVAPIWQNTTQAALNLVGKKSIVARVGLEDIFKAQTRESGHDFLVRKNAGQSAGRNAGNNTGRSTDRNAERRTSRNSGRDTQAPTAPTAPDAQSEEQNQPPAPQSPDTPAATNKWAINELGVEPALAGVVQLIRSSELRPVVGNANGMLVGELVDDGQIIWVVSDPDVLSNHGLHRGDNAVFAARLFERFTMAGGSPGGNLVFDETIHGYIQAQGSPIKLLFRFPFVIVTWLVCATAALLVLAGTRRFGVPRKPGRELDFGKALLIENSARLMDYAGHHAPVLKRYVRSTVNTTARALHAPPTLRGAALIEWLDRIGQARGLERNCSDILQNLDTANTDNQNTSGNANISRLFDCAGQIHRWKGEILDGSSTSRRAG